MATFFTFIPWMVGIILIFIFGPLILAKLFPKLLQRKWFRVLVEIIMTSIGNREIPEEKKKE